MLYELNYKPNVDDVIIVHTNDGMIRCSFYIFNSHSKPPLINSYGTPYLIKYICPYFSDGKLRHMEVKCLSQHHWQRFLDPGIWVRNLGVVEEWKEHRFKNRSSQV